MKFFKKSPVKNSVLQAKVKLQEVKELSLLLDCKTRWNSLVPMLERLLKLNNCLKDALEELGREDLYNEVDFGSLKNVIDVLKPIELAVKELSKIEATLLTAESLTFKFVFEKHKEWNTDLSIRGESDSLKEE